VLNWFKKKENTPRLVLKTDMHSHLLPGLDDGVKSFEESYQIIRHFEGLGYKKLITTPHVMQDVYRNTNDSILLTLQKLKTYLQEKNSPMQIEAAAEYYLDEDLLRKLNNSEPLLTFGNQYLLFETNFLNEPLNLKDFIFIASTQGYKLILAHPERYLYLYNNFSKVEDLLNRGVQFQINISSVTGYYSKQAQSMAYELINRGWVHWLASDCHHMMHAQLVNTARQNKYFQKALTLPLLNNTI
jgi:protein-tyrosine phosphatase